MPLVDLICLANSFKHGGRCVAGLRTDGTGWVRPLACDTAHGQLYLRHMKLEDGSEPHALDVISVNLERARPAPSQPENWLIGSAPWVLRERPAGLRFQGILQAGIERSDLLLGNSERTIPADAAVSSSLTLVAPHVVRWSAGRDLQYRQQPRALFKLGANWYCLPVTDPLWSAVIVRHLSGKQGWHPNGSAGLPIDAKIWLTVSLSEPLEGQCYKLVAGIVPVPRRAAGRKPVTSASRTPSGPATSARL